MSEAKRVPLQTLEFPESLGHATKEKKGNMGKQLSPSFRFTLTLPESNEKTCPEFNYAQLLKSAEVSRKPRATNVLSPHGTLFGAARSEKGRSKGAVRTPRIP